MADPTILFVKPTAISSADKRALAKAGVVVVEVANPQDVKLVKANTEIDGSEMLMCAAKAIKQGNSRDTYVAFASAIMAAIEARPSDRS